MLLSAELTATTCASQLAPTILVVEDEELIRLLMTEVLQEDGYRVEEAADVAQAKYILQTRAIDLVFSDINMPGTETGFALEKWVRRNFPQTKVVLTSGYPHPAADTRDLRVPLIPKPYNHAMVLKRFATLLGTC